MRVLVTGGTGFVGRSVVPLLYSRGLSIRLAVRNRVKTSFPHGIEQVSVGDIGPETDWTAALRGVDVVVHLAARAHVTREAEADPEAAFFATNYAATRQLADACSGHVRRFGYLSSIGVHGSTSLNGVFNESSVIGPDASYARSKVAAESYLQGLIDNGDLDCRILRPPLVYGPGAPGNLARLIRAVKHGVPLPLSRVRNRRSLIGVGHLARAVIAVLLAESVSRSTYVVSDREVVSTADIIRAIATGLDRPARLWALPTGTLRALGALAGRGDMVEQLVGSLEVDATNFRDDFGDLQSCPTLQGLSAAARAY